MIIANYLSFWWGQTGDTYSVPDDIRFVCGRYRSGDAPWITQRVSYTIFRRYGVAFKWRGDWRFLGYMHLTDRRDEDDRSTP